MAQIKTDPPSLIHREELKVIEERLFCGKPCGKERVYQHSRIGFTQLHFYQCEAGHKSASSTRYPNTIREAIE